MNKIHTIRKKAKTVVPRSHWIPEKLFQQIQKSMPIPTVDLIILRTGHRGTAETLLIKRKIYPDQGKWCLIGGRILKGEHTQDTIKRQAREELGVAVKIVPPWSKIMPFAVFNDPNSDKQKHFVALAYPVVITRGIMNANGPEFSEARWFSLNKLPARIGFYHRKVLVSISKHIKVRKS